MDELDALRQMRTALAEEEPAERIAMRTGWRPDAEKAPWRRAGDRPRRRRNWRIPLVSVVAAGAATVTAVSLISSGGSSGGSSGRTVGPGGQSTAPLPGNVLLVAASNAEKAPTGRYWHTETVLGEIYGVGKSAANHYKVDSRQRIVRWVGPDGERGGNVDLGGRPLTADDMRKWRQAGSPRQVEVPNNDGDSPAIVFMDVPRPSGPPSWRPGDGRYFGMTAKQVAALPTDAEALENVLLDLKGNWHAYTSSAEQEPIRALRGEERTRALTEVAATLLSTAPAPPKVRAAAFRMLAAVPGIKAEGTAADPMGRTGTVISLPLKTTMPLGLYTQPKQLGTYRRQWIIDPAAGKLLAVRDLVATPPRGSRPLPPGDNGKPRSLKVEDMPDRFHKPGELASYELFEVTEWTNTPPK